MLVDPCVRLTFATECIFNVAIHTGKNYGCEFIPLHASCELYISGIIVIIIRSRLESNAVKKKQPVLQKS